MHSQWMKVMTSQILRSFFIFIRGIDATFTDHYELGGLCSLKGFTNSESVKGFPVFAMISTTT
jgi:hypothetical protein